MKGEHAWVVAIVIVVIVIVPVVAAYLTETDEEDEVPLHPDKYPGTVTVENFESRSEEYGTWMEGTVTIYRTEDGFEGEISLQYYHDPEDPGHLQLYTRPDFVMTELWTDHDHMCNNVVSMSWHSEEIGSGLLIDRLECPYRDDGAISVHIESTYVMDPDQIQSEFIIAAVDDNALNLFVDLPLADDGDAETAAENYSIAKENDI